MVVDSDKIKLLKLINSQFNEFGDEEIYFRRGKTGVLSGLSGVALFKFYYSRYFNDETVSREAVKNIFDCFDIIKKPCYSTYCDGIAGFGWTMDHLAEFEFIENENDELLQLFDGHLEEMMKKEMTINNLDFLHGAAGYGCYFINRYKTTLDFKQKNKYESILRIFLNTVKELAHTDVKGISWDYPVSQKSKKGERWVNLGLSHGIPGMIILLVRLGETEAVDNSIIQDLLTGAVEYIMSSKNKEEIEYSLFPSVIDNGLGEKRSSRLSWCYGDLGIGIAFLRAGNFLNKTEYVELAKEIFLHACKRRSHSVSLVVDPMLCHGSFGLSQIFQQLNQELELSELSDAASFWLEDGLKHFKNSKGEFLSTEESANLKGYKWQSNSSLLTGLSGVGLSILSSLTLDNSWNKSLLIS